MIRYSNQQQQHQQQQVHPNQNLKRVNNYQSKIQKGLLKDGATKDNTSSTPVKIISVAPSGVAAPSTDGSTATDVVALESINSSDSPSKGSYAGGMGMQEEDGEGPKKSLAEMLSMISDSTKKKLEVLQVHIHMHICIVHERLVYLATYLYHRNFSICINVFMNDVSMMYVIYIYHISIFII